MDNIGNIGNIGKGHRGRASRRKRFKVVVKEKPRNRGAEGHRG